MLDTDQLIKVAKSKEYATLNRNERQYVRLKLARTGCVLTIALQASFEHQISSSLSFPDTLGFEYRINSRTLVSLESAANFSIGFEEFSRYAAGINIAPAPSFGEDDGLAPVDVGSP